MEATGVCWIPVSHIRNGQFDLSPCSDPQKVVIQGSSRSRATTIVTISTPSHRCAR